MAKITTTNFLLELPELGSYLGSWHTPVNANTILIDTALQNLKRNNYQLTQGAVVDEGTTWYKVATHQLFLHNGTSLKRLITEDDFIIDLIDQGQLINGQVIDLHIHPGYSDYFFRVKDPTLAASGNELTNKPYYAVPFKLFNDTVSGMNAVAATTTSNVATQTAKLNGISTNGIDVHIQSATVSGNVQADGILIPNDSDGSSILIAAGQILISKAIPINIGTSQASGTIDLQVNGNKVWNTGNMGDGSGLDAGKLSGRLLDDTKAHSVNYLWTSEKTKQTITEDIAAIPHYNLDAATADALGGVKIGDGITITDGKISTPNGFSSIGGVPADKPGDTLLLKGATGDSLTVTADTATNTITFSGGTPTGAVIAYAGELPPNGYVLCNGALYSVTDPKYQALYSVIGVTYGSGTNTFRVPNCMGYFIRGLDSQSKSIDPADLAKDSTNTLLTGNRTLGSTQMDGFMNFTGTWRGDDQSYGTGAISSVYGGSEGYSQDGPFATNTLDPSKVARTSAFETRPKNIAMNYIIKL